MVVHQRTLCMLAAGAVLCVTPVGHAMAADASAQARYLLATGRPAEAARRTAAMLHAGPAAPETVMLHARAVAALGEAGSFVEAIGTALHGPDAIAYVGAVADGFTDGRADCPTLLAAVGTARTAAEWQAHMQVRERVRVLCGASAEEVFAEAVPILNGSAAGLALRLSAADAAWGRAVEAWAADDPLELCAAGNPWSSEASGLGLVKARVALAAAAERAAESEEPMRLWWAREVMRWQGLETDALDARIALLDPEARVPDWQTAGGVRWYGAPQHRHPEWVAKLEAALAIEDPDLQRDALDHVGALLPITGPLRSDWWAARGALLEAEGRSRAHVRAMESAWRADPERGERANGFAWAAAQHRVRMSVALDAIDAAIVAPMPYRAARGGPSADGAFRWVRGHELGSWLDTRGWLRLQMGDVTGARADFDRALMLYRSPSATVHFHAAFAAERDGAPEVALFHLREGFAVVDTRYDDPELVAEARAMADALYGHHRWHPAGVDGWLAGRSGPAGRAEVGEPGSIVGLESMVDALNRGPMVLPGQGQALPTLPFLPDGEGEDPSVGGGWRVVELWAEWCGPCQTQVARLTELHEQARAQGLELGVVVVSVEVEHRKHWPGPLGSERPLGWVVGWSGPVALELLGATGLPATLVVDPTGRVVNSRLGWEGDLAWLEDTLSEHIAGLDWPTAVQEDAP